MITDAQLLEMVKKAREATKERKFKQSIELIITFKDIDVKKGFAINEVVQLPKTSSPATVCIIATGDMNQNDRGRTSLPAEGRTATRTRGRCRKAALD